MQQHSDRRPAPRYIPQDVVLWRWRVLLEAGCETAMARGLAADGDLDLHELLSLIDRGCPPAGAARILAPLDR